VVELPLVTAERVERHLSNGEWPEETSLDAFRDALAATPGKVAVVGPRGRYTYRELDEQSDALATTMARHGVGRGDRVCVQLPNWREFPVVRLAQLKLAAVINAIPPAYRASEVTHVVETLDPAAFVVAEGYDDHSYVGMLRDELDFGGLVYAIDGGGGDGVHAFADAVDATPEPSRFDEHDPAWDLSEVSFTSGTTGDPKGVMHVESAQLAGNRTYAERAGFDADDTMLMPSTFGHRAGFQLGVNISLVHGATVVAVDDWSGERGIELIEAHDATHVYAATPFLHDLVTASNRDDHDTSSLEHFGCGGAEIPRPLLEEANHAFDAAVCAGWGQNEVGLVTLTPSDAPLEKRVGTDGCPLQDVAVRTTADDGRSEGEVLARGSTLMAGFYGMPAETRSRMRDGWYCSGDVARIDDDGYLVFVGRENDIIMRGGEQIPTDELDDLLYEHPKVDEAAVVAMPDDRLQERACAYVKPVDGESFAFEEMVAHLDDQHILQRKYPERLEILSAFPRTPSGSIQRFKLRQDVADKLDADPVR